jgi:uncharacterized protein with von Willebrand factor type A (vWA) domain
MVFLDKEGLFSKEENVTNVKSFDSLDENNRPIQENAMDLVFILDKSGSMWNVVEDTIGGFNSFIEREKAKDIKTYVTLVLFDDEYKILYTRKPIEEVKELTSEEYFAGGCTALLDAVGTTIESLDGEVARKVMFVITTDGLENASRKYTKGDVKKLIQSHNWEFLFIGADIDSYGEAMTMGISANRTANYEKSSAGLGSLFGSVSRFRCAYDSDDKEEMERGWKEDLD